MPRTAARLALALVLLGAAVPAAAGDYDRAEAAYADGDFVQARALAASAALGGDVDALALKGAASEALGDRADAAEAYAKAAASADGAKAALWRARAEALRKADDAEAARKASAKARPTATPRPSAVPTSTPSPEPTPQPSAAPTAVPTAAPTPEPTPQPSAAATPDAELERQKAELERERQALALEREKLRLERERAALDKDKAAPAGPDGGLWGPVLYLGVGGYNNKLVDNANEYAQMGGGSGGMGQMRHVGEIEFPVDFAAGLRWNGFVLEGFHQSGLADYELAGSNGTASIEFTLDGLALGYDWAFLRWKALELALPLRLEAMHVDVSARGQSEGADLFGLAGGLAARVWMGRRFVLEARVLAHGTPGENEFGLPPPDPSIPNQPPYNFRAGAEGVQYHLGLGVRLF